MNIFVLNWNPAISAKMMCDKHVVKMILETGQLLSSCHHFYKSSFSDEIYKPTHINHPCNIWLRQSASNYKWLYEHFIALLKEYNERYGKTHKTSRLVPYLKNIPQGMPDIGLTSFAQAMPEQYRNSDPVKAYQRYYLGEKLYMAKYKLGNVPDFIRNGKPITNT